jgi:hypothetical protein
MTTGDNGKRREFFRSCGRGALLAALGAVGAFATSRGEEKCPVDAPTPCRQCRFLAKCKLPRAEAERTLTARFHAPPRGGVNRE